MANAVRPETINKLRSAAEAAFAMLAGMQLDVFTPLKNDAHQKPERRFLLLVDEINRLSVIVAVCSGKAQDGGIAVTIPKETPMTER